MQRIPVILLLCAPLAFCQQQDIDQLLDGIFTPDNSGFSNNNNNQNQMQGSTIPTPVLVQGGNNQKQQPDNILSHILSHIYSNTVGNPCGPSAECVPYYQCANGSIITDDEGLVDIRFGQGDNTNNKEHPCPGLFETCCNLRSNSSNDLPKPTHTRCGVRNVNGVGFRIIGDKDNEAQFGEFPWTVAILKEEKALNGQILNVYVCGGSIIDPGVILTAAHCVSQKDPKTLKVRAGEWDTQTKDEIYPHQDRQVRNYVIHPEYYKEGLFNDIALLFLTEPVDIAEHVNTVCLPQPDDVFDGNRCFASGWGKDLFGKEGKYQVILKRLELPIVPREPCLYKLRNTHVLKDFQLHKSNICAGGEGDRDICKVKTLLLTPYTIINSQNSQRNSQNSKEQDGGSPLVCHVNNGQYVQAGIVSWGIGCGENKTPAVYVNVPIFRNWIDEQMKLAYLTPYDLALA